MEPTAAKAAAYSQLVTASDAWVGIDAWLAEHALATWKRIRTIDDWLVLYRADDRVGVEQYRRQCEQLKSLYEQHPDGWGLDDDNV